MNKILLLTVVLALPAFSQVSEDAIILNQELQFLEDSANNVTVESRAQASPQNRARPIDTTSLEEKYFGTESDDAVSTRAAAPKRRKD